MSDEFFQIMFTPAVLAAQEKYNGHADPAPRGGLERVTLSDEERAYIAKRDSFYLATVSETGWPYMQHRGGPKGFLKVLDERTLGFADFAGNRQMITVGNLAGNDRVALFLMNYPRRERMKILGHARVIAPAADAALAARLVTANYRGRVERLFVIEVAAVDWNCPQHINPREEG